MQKQSLSAAEGQHLAGLTVLTLTGMRSEEMFNLFFESLNIWRNGPYIGGHLAFFFQIEFQTRL